MNILEKCQKWHENNEHQKIIETLEAIDANERTPEMDSVLARAYNNEADHRMPEGRQMLHRAIELLEPHEDNLGETPLWNFRIGYAYYYLDQEGKALTYFRRANQADPEDKDTKTFIESCQKSISLPRFSETFRERTQNAWAAFEAQEAELRGIMDADRKHENGQMLIERCESILAIAFDNIAFEMGFNGVKHELILTPEGDRQKLFELVYFRNHAPQSVLEHWNILVGRQGSTNMGLRVDGIDVDGNDVLVWLEPDDDEYRLFVYCEKLLEKKAKEEGRVWWMLTNLTDQILGEIPHMRFISDFEVLDEARPEPAIRLAELPEKLKSLGKDLSLDAQELLENSYLGYQAKPDEDPEADWRLDIIAGSTRSAPLINGYMSADNETMDDLHADGIVAGFVCFPLDGFTGDDRTQEIFDFREALENRLAESCGSDFVTLIGGATGLYYGYVDFIAWDLLPVLEEVKAFFEESNVAWASFHTFRREAGTVPLKTIEEKKTTFDQEASDDEVPELDETLTGMDYIPYTPDNAEAFFSQLEQWNDDDEFIRCIQALNAIPEDLRNYRIAYAMARALENYAILGDHGEGTPSYKGDKTLRRAIEVLESVREDGQDKAQWHMRMAYGYQYLNGQEEKAIPYAKRWAELDPEDEDAVTVIKECEAEIAKRESSDTASTEDADKKGMFAGSVLLSKGEWDRNQLMDDLAQQWNIDVDDDEKHDTEHPGVLLITSGDMIGAITLMRSPVPNGEAEECAENNYMWPDAVKVAKEHAAHILVAVIGKEEDVLERGRFYTKLVAACCRQAHATGIYTSGVVFEPSFYEEMAEIMKEGELPLNNWIWFGLYRTATGVNAYTYGMDVFGKEELEVLDANAEPMTVREFLVNLVGYVLDEDVTLKDGETIGFSAEDKHRITRSQGVALPEQMTLKVSWDSSDDDPDDTKGSTEEADASLADKESLEVYAVEEMKAIENHVEQHFGTFEKVFHEHDSQGVHIDICIVPPSGERDYFTLVTMGMGAHRMNVPAELTEYKLERAELAIALPKDWKLGKDDLKDEAWYWPIRLLKVLAHLPIDSNTWLGFGHTMDNEETFASNTELCAVILTGPQGIKGGEDVCLLPNGDEVNFYQVIPLYRDELAYKVAHDADALLEKMQRISFVVNPSRPNVLTQGTLGSEEAEVVEMDDGAWHIETILEKKLPVDELCAYNHMAIYLRWCMTHDLMNEAFLAEYGSVVEKVKANPANVDLRVFIRDELDGQLVGPLFNQKGRAFASYYYGKQDSPYFPSDIDNYAIGMIGEVRNYSDEIQDEAYLFIPFDEVYYQAMAKVMDTRFANWHGQRFDETTLEPSEVAQSLMEFLDCECTYFPSMADDDPIMAAYSYAKRDCEHEGFIPMLIRADDETLLECLVMNADPAHDDDIHEFDSHTVGEYRKKWLNETILDGNSVLQSMIGDRRSETEDDDMDWEKEVLGEMAGGYDNHRFSSYWNSETDMTYPLILAKIPVKKPWEIFAYLPFGQWNDCPDTPQLMAVSKYWYEKFGAVPAVMSHDELEFVLPKPVDESAAMDTALEHYGFCPDVIEQGPEDATVGRLADELRQSKVWYFWWD